VYLLPLSATPPPFPAERISGSIARALQTENVSFENVPFSLIIFLFASQGCTTIGINDTGGKFSTGVNFTGGKFSSGINDTRGKFFYRHLWCCGVVDSDGKYWDYYQTADTLKCT
jgi:hypothetical protein